MKYDVIEKNIILLEDAAHSFGSTLNKKFSGTFFREIEYFRAVLPGYEFHQKNIQKTHPDVKFNDPESKLRLKKTAEFIKKELSRLCTP